MSHGFTPYVELLSKLPAWDFTNTTLFDAGAGYGELGFYLKALTETPRVKFRGTPKLIGCDVNTKMIKKAGQGIYDEYYGWDLRDTPYTFLQRKPKFLACLETLEHFPGGKEESLRTLSYLEAISPNIIVSVPNGNHLNNKNPVKEFNHYSTWSSGDFTKRGYHTQPLSMMGLQGRSRRLYELYRGLTGSSAEYILAIKQDSRYLK